MGLFDWLRPKPVRSITTIAREIAEAVFALHPAALDRVVITLDGDRIAVMEVPALDPERPVDSQVDPAQQTARIAELVAELRSAPPQTEGNELTVMRDRVIWMPSVVTFPEPVA